jgi:hypothetical protein
MWYAVVEKATNRLHSIGTVLADPLPPQFTAIALDNEPDLAIKIWDPTTQTFITDDTFAAIADKVLNTPAAAKLTAAEKADLKTRITSALRGQL